CYFFFFQAEDGIRDFHVTGVQTCALPILNLTIAHQYIEQMEEEVRNAVFGNVGTIISFRVGPFDAEVLETIFTPQFLAADIVNLGFAQIYLTLMIDGIGSQPVSATPLPSIKPVLISFKDVILHRSREQ